MNKGIKSLKVVSDHASRLDRTIDNLNIRQDYRTPESPYLNSASFTMARMAQVGLSNEDIAYAFILPVEDVEASIRFTQNYQAQHPSSYNQMMGNRMSSSSEDDFLSNSLFSDGNQDEAAF